MDSVIVDVFAKDIRFPTTLTQDGSDAINDPDYSCVYVTVSTDTKLHGYGITFTCGRGNDIVLQTVNAYKGLVIGRRLKDIYGDFGSYWQELTHEPQMRWLGPEKGVTHLALAAIINALWDLWAKIENKPLWKLLVDMDPEQLISTMDFRYITDALTKEEALDILRRGQDGKKQREQQIISDGFPAYTTSAGWLGYSEERIKKECGIWLCGGKGANIINKQLCKEALAEGFTRFKVKVGLNQQDDVRRVGLVRQEIGDSCKLMTDANQRWGVQEAIDWMIPMAKYNITWIEEPTSPDDIVGHAKISEGLRPYGIGVATGENCHNRVMFKQLLQLNAIQFCQIDSCRLAGPNEILTVYLMAAKFNIPVCPHAGGVGLCELVQHLSMFDYICIAKTFDNRIIEYVDHLHEHFSDPVVIRNGNYMAPKKPGYSTEMLTASLDEYEYPTGSAWQELFKQGIYEASDVAKLIKNIPV